MTTAEQDRQFRRAIQKTLRDQKEAKVGQRRQARLRAARLREIEDLDAKATNGGNAAKALWISFEASPVLSDTWGGKVVRHRLRSIEYVTDDDGSGDPIEPPDGMQSFSADELGKNSRYPGRIGLNKKREFETVDEDETT
ncbi:hypothetical protein NS365_05565 [Aureimonas ureilytica]|uniref:Uncharacterized protein n=1 Tax=Aureimonas ureilytica TaxID=401562 RepID=A0A175RVM7_9HYPH|nr:hypothetical protein [Aureimonas ureilytica]KTR06902.1 hypothetical protein NS365_05565 [Aureimonas ureilytica]